MNGENIIVKLSQKDNNFIIYEKDKLLGIFGIPHIIKYITSKISNDFLKDIEYESSIEIIEKFFCKFDNNDNIILIGYLNSPIMGNIEIMMKIYSEINKFDQTILQTSIEKIESKIIKNKIIKAIRNLEYLILNHSLKLIVNISDAIKNDNSKNELKINLVKYSIFITNKINYIICDNISDTKTDIILLNAELEQMKNIKSGFEKKFKKLENAIERQNLQIQKIINFIDIDTDIDINTDTDTDTDTDTNTDADIDINIDNLNQNNDYKNDDLHLINQEFNDSDYSYTEETNKKTSVEYLTPV
jgi:hypothetical protein